MPELGYEFIVGAGFGLVTGLLLGLVLAILLLRWVLTNNVSTLVALVDDLIKMRNTESQAAQAVIQASTKPPRSNKTSWDD